MNSAENNDMAVVMALYAQRVLVHARVTRAVADGMPLSLEKKKEKWGQKRSTPLNDASTRMNKTGLI